MRIILLFKYNGHPSTEFMQTCPQEFHVIQVGDIFLHRHYHTTNVTIPFNFYVSWLIVTKVTRQYVYLSRLRDTRFTKEEYLFTMPILPTTKDDIDIASFQIKKPNSIFGQSEYKTPFDSYKRVVKNELDGYHMIEIYDGWYEL